MTTTTTNRYPGDCADCVTYVEAGAGVYTDRVLRCAPAANPTTYEIDGITVLADTYACPTYQRREAKQKAAAIIARAAFVESPQEIADRTARAAVRAEQDMAWAARGLARCQRCGGAGGHSSWPGFNCYDCDGRGTREAATLDTIH